jgi:hypothetical protein
MILGGGGDGDRGGGKGENGTHEGSWPQFSAGVKPH